MDNVSTSRKGLKIVKSVKMFSSLRDGIKTSYFNGKGDSFDVVGGCIFNNDTPLSEDEALQLHHEQAGSTAVQLYEKLHGSFWVVGYKVGTLFKEIGRKNLDNGSYGYSFTDIPNLEEAKYILSKATKPPKINRKHLTNWRRA